MHKIALFGTGHIRRLVAAGINCLMVYGTKENSKNFEPAVSVIKNNIEYRNYKSLVEAYMKVQHKYYPEKDILINSKEKKII